MYTAASLRSYTHKDLAQMAKQRGVSKWHSMRKDELVRALVKAAKAEAGKSNSVYFAFHLRESFAVDLAEAGILLNINT